MKELEFMELLSELPPEYIEAAAGPQQKRRGIIFRKLYGIPVIAACLVVIIAAAIYPRLRVEKPEQVPEPEQTTYTTAIAGTEPCDASEPAVTVTTRRDAAAEQTGTAVQSAAQTSAVRTRDTEPAQTAASVQQTAQNHAAANFSASAANTTASVRTSAKTTARTTAPAKTTARTTARMTAPARTTAKTTTRTTAPAKTTAKTTARTTAPAKTTAKTTEAALYTEAPHALTTPAAAMRTTEPPSVATTAMMTVDYTQTNAAAVTTARDGSNGGGHWQPGSSGGPNASPGNPASPGDNPGSGWQHHNHGEQPPGGMESAEVFFLQTLVPVEADEYLDGKAFVGQAEDGGGYILPDAFAGYSLPEQMNPADYYVLPVYYYGYICDAVVTGADYSGYSGFEPSVCILETGSTFRQFTALFWIPKDIPVEPDRCSANIAVEWSAEGFYGNLPEIGDTVVIRFGN